METVSETLLEKIENTRALFFDDFDFNCKDEKRKFVNWYIENHKAPMDVLISDLSNYYLHISTERVSRYIQK